HSDESSDEGSSETHTELNMDSDIRADIKAEIAAATTTAAAIVGGLDFGLVLTGVEMGFETELAFVESESKPKEAKVDDKADVEIEQEGRNLIANDERSGLLERVVSLEGSNMRLRDALGVKRVRADSLQRRLGYDNV
ncbi:hypothetical protein Tco_1120216, partial [Tanacetum coccineum]